MTKPTSESVHHHVKKKKSPNKIPLGVPWIQGRIKWILRMFHGDFCPEKEYLNLHPPNKKNVGPYTWATSCHLKLRNKHTNHPKVLKITTQKMNHKNFPWPSQSPIQSPPSPPTSPVVAPTSCPCQVFVVVRRRPPWPWRAPREPRGTGSSGAGHGVSSENAMAWRFRWAVIGSWKIMMS